MIQRTLFNILKIGIDEITRDISILEDLFIEQHNLESAEVASIVTLWKAKPPNVIHGYADADSKFPLYAITLLGERETDKFIGDSAGDVMDENDPDFPGEQNSSIWRHEYAIWVYSDHPDVTSYYYEVAKHVILTAGPIFIQNFIMDIDVAGMDMTPDPRYLPSHLFVRQLKFSCKRELLRVDPESKLGKAFKVSGIHVDSSGSPSDVGGVKTNVTIDTGDDDE
jgi:hypothetical protein